MHPRILMFVTLVALATRSTYGLEDLIGLPVDYDETQTFNAYLSDWDKEQDIWNEELINPEKNDDSFILLKKLCQNYKLSLNDKIIDCESLSISKRNQQQEHILKKREADVLEEGSGEADHEEHTPEEEKMIPVEPSTQVSVDDTNESPEDKDDSSKKETEDTAGAAATLPAVLTEEPKVRMEIVPPASPVEEPHEEATVQPEDKGSSKTPEITAAVTENPDKIPVSKDDLSKEKEAPVTVNESDKRGKKLQTSANEAEEISSNQSGVALDETLGNAEELDKNVPRSKTKASIMDIEEPKSGESSENAGQGRKDTRILIGLFVVVVAVGGAAFAYNYIRKRKRNVNRAQNGISKTDPEEGREMKPLMKTPPNEEYKEASTSEVKS